MWRWYRDETETEWNAWWFWSSTDRFRVTRLLHDIDASIDARESMWISAAFLLWTGNCWRMEKRSREARNIHIEWRKLWKKRWNVMSFLSLFLLSFFFFSFFFSRDSCHDCRDNVTLRGNRNLEVIEVSDNFPDVSGKFVRHDLHDFASRVWCLWIFADDLVKIAKAQTFDESGLPMFVPHVETFAYGMQNAVVSAARSWPAQDKFTSAI